MQKKIRFLESSSPFTLLHKSIFSKSAQTQLLGRKLRAVKLSPLKSSRHLNSPSPSPPPLWRHIKALANGFNICFNIHSILLNAVERLFNDVELWVSKRFQHFFQQNLASGLVISFRPQLFSRLRHARAPF